MSSPSEHDLTLRLFEQVAAQLVGAERDALMADRELIKELLELGEDATPEQIAVWVRDADHH
jgi:hypothetical protein